MKDPVCGAHVDEKSAPATSSYQGQKYGFCGKECKDKFDQNPERYAHSGQGSHQSGQGSQPQGQGSEKGSQQRQGGQEQGGSKHQGSQQLQEPKRGSQHPEKVTR